MIRMATCLGDVTKVWRDSFIVWHDSFTLIYIFRIATCLGDVTKVCRDSFIHMCAMTHLNSFIWLVWELFLWTWPRCDVTHVYTWHDSCICVKWLIYLLRMATCRGDVTRVWRDWCIRMPWLFHMCYMTQDLYISKFLSSESQDLHHPNLKISILWIPKSLNLTIASSKSHELYDLHPTIPTNQIPPTLSSNKSHELCHPNPTNSILYIPQSLPCKSHQHHPLHLKISILQISRTLSWKPTNSILYISQALSTWDKVVTNKVSRKRRMYAALLELLAKSARADEGGDVDYLQVVCTFPLNLDCHATAACMLHF